MLLYYCAFSWFELGPHPETVAVYFFATKLIFACRVPNVLLRGHVCRTNVASNTAFRGFGSPQAMLVAEHWITQIAAFLKVSPDEVECNCSISKLCSIETFQYLYFNLPINFGALHCHQ